MIQIKYKKITKSNKKEIIRGMKFKEINKKEIKINIKNIIIEKNILKKNHNTFFTLIFRIIMIILFPSFLSKKIYLRNLNSELEITLTINGTGAQYILSDESINFEGKTCKFDNLTTQIILNNNKISEKIGHTVNILINEENNIALKWDYEITDCCVMFYGLSNITKIIFTNFNSSISDMSGMFYNCNSLISLDFNIFNTSSATNMFSMFHSCRSLISLNLNNYDTSLVTNMASMFEECTSLQSLYIDNFNTKRVLTFFNMFYNCRKLISLNLKNFDTSSVTHIGCKFYDCRELASLNVQNFNTSSNKFIDDMFYSCRKLKSLNLTNFNTSLVEKMNDAFSYCYELEYLDLSNFDTSKVTRMDMMFEESKSLKYLNLKNFDTSKVERMEYMFSGCKSLISENISNFDTSRVTNMFEMFTNCESLISLDLRKFNTSSIENATNIFSGCNQALKYCINEDMATQMQSELTGFINNCSDNCFALTQSQLIVKKNICIDFCYNDDIYKFEYNNLCYQSCPNGTHNLSFKDYICEKDLICDNYYNYNYTDCIDEIPEGYYLNSSDLKTIDKCDIKCENCSLESKINDLCITCNNKENYYSKYNDSSNNNSFINCYNKEFEGYFLDNISKTYIPCYSSCKKCDEFGDEENNKCTECFPNYILNNYYNCKEEIKSDFSLYTENDYYINEIYSSYNFNEFNDYSEYIMNEETDYDIYENDSLSYYEKYNNYGKKESFNENIEYIINQLILSKNLCKNNIYYYSINLKGNDLKRNYNNITFIDFTQETFKFLINQFHLDEEKDKLYLVIIDYFVNDLNYATTDYDYKIFFENGTELNLSNINENFYFDIYVPMLWCSKL